MKISSIFYCLKQGVRNVFRNRWFSLASIATIAACLFIFGMFFSILKNVDYMVKNAESNVCVSALLVEDISDERIFELQTQLLKRVEVKEVTYVSAEETWEQFIVDNNMEEYVDGFLENPLADCAHFDIYMSDVSMQSTLVSYLEGLDGVRKVNQSALTAQTLTGVNAIIGYVSIGIIAVLFFVSIFLISNTVTIGISIRKEEIQIMKYIGATDFFVRAPFVIEGIIIGLIGSVLPLIGIYFIYNEAMIYAAERFPYLSQLIKFIEIGTIFENLVPICVAIGVGIGFLGSFTTVRKHLSV